MSAPPQHGKSIQIIDFLTWLAGKYPHLKTIFASFSKRLGIRANLRINRIVNGILFKEVFPDFKLPTAKDKGYTNNREMIEYLGAEGSFRNTTVNGSVTGESLDLGVLDDPIKGREAANSELIRQKAWDWFTDDFYTRFSEDAGLLIIGTRWHIDDPIGRIIEANPDNLTILSYPAIAEVDDEHRKAGEPLFPELKSLQFLMLRKKALTIENWLSLYQQTPVMVDGNIFKREDWRYYDILPKIRYSIIIGDTAQKTKVQHDYTVFMLLCLGEDKNIYIHDIIRGKFEAPQLRIQLKAFWNKHKANPDLKLRYVGIEDKSSGTGLIQTVKQYDKIPIVAIQRDSQDKVSRAQSVSPVVASGYVYLLRNAHWLSDFLTELTLFNNGKHDDQVDCVSDGIDQLHVVHKEYKVRTIGGAKKSQ